jgi:hypothetical protein
MDHCLCCDQLSLLFSAIFFFFFFFLPLSLFSRALSQVLVVAINEPFMKVWQSCLSLSSVVFFFFFLCFLIGALQLHEMAWMFQQDSVHGRFNGTVEEKDGKLVINGKAITVFSEKGEQKAPLFVCVCLCLCESGADAHAFQIPETLLGALPTPTTLSSRLECSPPPPRHPRI